MSVRGGGHNIAGTALVDGGLTIDMSRLREVAVDPVARTATVQTGCLLGDVDRATQAHGLAVPLGFFSEVGVAGLTLGGGLGYLTRRFGWAVDNLLAAEIVTADGQVRRASRDEHADLFWALRGAGARLGVVTELTFRLHEVGPTVFGGLIAWPFERAAEILDAYRALTAQAPRELAVWLNVIRAPEAPFVPPEWHGERVCAMVVCYSGDRTRGGARAAPRARRAGVRHPARAAVHRGPVLPRRHRAQGRALLLEDRVPRRAQRRLPRDAPRARRRVPDPGSPSSAVLHIGGALNEHEPDDGAVGNRDAPLRLRPDRRLGAGRAAGRRVPRLDPRRGFERVRPFGTGGNYVNFQSADEGEDRIRASYGANYDRLMEVKRAYDPDDVFRWTRAS